MKTLTFEETNAIAGGVDKNSEAYKIGKECGEGFRKAAEVIGVVALFVGAALSGQGS